MKTIYLDMDGVVADFNAYAQMVLRKKETHHNWPHEEWVKLRENPRLYRDLEKTPYADLLVNTCLQICHDRGWQLIFLTAVPNKNDMHWAFYDKVMWVQKHFPTIPVHFGPFSKDKHVHAQPGDILIDDRTSNIREWTVAGGIGIYHTDIEKTLQELADVTA